MAYFVDSVGPEDLGGHHEVVQVPGHPVQLIVTLGMTVGKYVE